MSIRVRGVALVVASSRGHILVLQELQSKPHLGKYSGMYSVPMETSNPEESDESALKRLLSEELTGLELAELSERPIGWYMIVPGVKVTLYTSQAVDDRLPTYGVGLPEVTNHQWVPVTEVRKLWLRQGAYEMLSDYIEGRTGVSCLQCRDVFPASPHSL